MTARIEILNGTEALIIESGTSIEVTPLETLAAYCELFNEPDPVKALTLARGTRAVPSNPDGTNVWTPLFAVLEEGLGEAVEAGVPDEFLPDVLDPTVGSPVPRKDRIDAAQAAVRERISKAIPKPGAVTESTPPVGDTAGLSTLLRGKSDEIRASRVAFLADLTPERKPETVTEPPPLFDEPLQIQLTTPSADTINAVLVSTEGI